MSASATRKSVLYVVNESTAGTPVAVSASTEAVALQEGFSLEPAFETQENAELRSSIGQAAPIQGLEAPTASVDHYIRHSGVEGTEPNYGKFLQSLFGAKQVNATEYSTTAGSTAGTSAVRAVVKSAGNASNFQRGEGLLIKDSVNGYSVRNVFSVDDANTLGLSFNLANAATNSSGLGKAVLYYPADSGENSMTLWLYRANGGAVEMISGAKTSEMSMDVTVGELVNASFAFDGVSYYFNPIITTSSTRYLDFTDDDGTWAIAVAAKAWKDPHELASAIQTAMNATGTTETHSVVYSDTTGKFTIATSTSTVLSLLWNTGANTANTIATKVGFSAAADSTGATTYTSATAYTLTAPNTPSYDSADPIAAKYAEVMMGDFDDYSCACVQSMSFSFVKTLTSVPCICAESGVAEKIASLREVTMEVTATLDPYDADKFRRFRSNSDISFAFNFGVRTGANWTAGKTCNLYIPTAKISNFRLDDADGVVVMTYTLSAFVDSSGNGEIYLNFL